MIEFDRVEAAAASRPGFRIGAKLRTPRCLAGVAVALGVLAAAGPAQAAISISRAELQGTTVRIEGSGAVANRIVTGTPGALSTTADGKGAFRLESSFFSAPPDCTVTVSDGVTSAPGNEGAVKVRLSDPSEVGGTTAAAWRSSGKARAAAVNCAVECSLYCPPPAIACRGNAASA